MMTDTSVKDDARAGYKAAIDLLNAEASQTWMRFNAMLVANSIVVAVFGQLLARTENLSLPWGVFLVLPLAGLVLCFAWLASIDRGIHYQDHYLMAAKAIEGRYLAPVVTVLVEGGGVQMKGFGKVRTRTAARGVVWLFMILDLCGVAWVWYGPSPAYGAGEMTHSPWRQWFFGNLSPFQIATGTLSVVGTAFGIYAIYKLNWAGPRVKIHSGDRLFLVAPIGDKAPINLTLAVTNLGSRVGVLQFLEAEITTATGSTERFEWSEFYKWGYPLDSGDPNL